MNDKKKKKNPRKYKYADSFFSVNEKSFFHELRFRFDCKIAETSKANCYKVFELKPTKQRNLTKNCKGKKLRS